MIKRFKITGVSKKFKGVQKLKPQKAPGRFTSVMLDETVKAKEAPNEEASKEEQKLESPSEKK